MQVILIEDVKKLGKLGDVINVKRGYARNFLFPRKLAAAVTANSMKSLEQIKKKITILFGGSVKP